MKKFLFCLGFLMLTNQVFASDIAIIDLDEIIKNSTAMANVNKTLENEKAGIEKKLKIEEQKLTDEKNSLESTIKTLSQDVAQKKAMEFQQKVLAFQQEVRENETNLQKKYIDSVAEITNTIKQIVSDIKTEKNSKYDFDVVLPASMTIYHNSELDISSEVLSRLNKKLKTVKVLKAK